MYVRELQWVLAVTTCVFLCLTMSQTITLILVTIYDGVRGWVLCNGGLGHMC